VLTDKDVATHTNHLMPAAVNLALREFRQLRPISDTRIQPFVDACVALIQVRSDYDAGAGSRDDVLEKYRIFSDEYDKLHADRALMEQMLHEFI
jgi:hypothetical protein